MKKNMLLLAWLMAAGMPVLAQNAYLENLKLENRTVEKADGKVRVQADICLDGVDLKRQQSLRLVPVLVSADGTQEALLPAAHHKLDHGAHLILSSLTRGSSPPACVIVNPNLSFCQVKML